MIDYGRRARANLRADPALRYFGAVLALTHVLTFAFWSRGGVMLEFLSDRSATPPICWPFFPACGAIEVPHALLAALSYLYLIVALGAAVSFVRARGDGGWWTLLGLTVFKWLLLALDYRAMGNYHYMTFLVILAFLFVPNPRRACALLIVGFYVAAGTLKLNAEWLTGRAIFGTPVVRGIGLEWLCIGAVLIELVGVWGLLSRDRVVRSGALAMLIVFHVFSWHIVGFFYPLTMFAMLALFPLAWSIRAPAGTDRWLPAHAVVLGLFILAQAIPRLQDGDPALISRGRLFALDMFDAYAHCHATVVVKFDGASYEVPPDARGLAPRIACDPIIFWNQARALCRANVGVPHFRDVDVFLVSGRSGQTPAPVMGVRDFCAQNPSYHTLLANAWEHP